VLFVAVKSDTEVVDLLRERIPRGTRRSCRRLLLELLLLLLLLPVSPPVVLQCPSRLPHLLLLLLRCCSRFFGPRFPRLSLTLQPQ